MLFSTTLIATCIVPTTSRLVIVLLLLLVISILWHFNQLVQLKEILMHLVFLTLGVASKTPDLLVLNFSPDLIQRSLGLGLNFDHLFKDISNFTWEPSIMTTLGVFDIYFIIQAKLVSIEMIVRIVATIIYKLFRC